MSNNIAPDVPWIDTPGAERVVAMFTKAVGAEPDAFKENVKKAGLESLLRSLAEGLTHEPTPRERALWRLQKVREAQCRPGASAKLARVLRQAERLCEAEVEACPVEA